MSLPVAEVMRRLCSHDDHLDSAERSLVDKAQLRLSTGADLPLVVEEAVRRIYAEAVEPQL